MTRLSSPHLADPPQALASKCFPHFTTLAIPMIRRPLDLLTVRRMWLKRQKRSIWGYTQNLIPIPASSRLRRVSRCNNSVRPRSLSEVCARHCRRDGPPHGCLQLHHAEVRTSPSSLRLSAPDHHSPSILIFRSALAASSARAYLLLHRPSSSLSGL